MNTENHTEEKDVGGNHLPSRTQSWRWVMPLLALLSAVSACNLNTLTTTGKDEMTAAVYITSTQVAQLVQETLSVLATQTALAAPASPTSLRPSPFPTFTPTPTAATPTATDTALTQTASLPTPTDTPQSPSITPVVVYDGIRFRQGGTSAYAQKSIDNGKQHRYTVRALEGQSLCLNVSSPNNDVYLEVKGLQDSQQLLWAGAQATSWTGLLPKTQDYLITLTTSNPGTTYFLAVEVPAKISFDPGAYSDTIEGYIDVDDVFHPDVLTRVRYLAYASAGQVMTVKLSSPNLDDLSLGIVGEKDGQVYLRYEVKNSGGTIELPATQGYYIDVYSTSGKSTSFTLKVTIH